MASNRSYRSGSVGRFDNFSRYRPPPTSFGNTSRYSTTTTSGSTPSASGYSSGYGTRSFRATSVGPFADTSSSTRSSYRSPYNRDSTTTGAMSSSFHGDYGTRNTGSTSRFSSGYKPSSTMTSSLHSSITSGRIGSGTSGGYTPSSTASVSAFSKPPARSTSYTSGLAFEPSGTSFGSASGSRYTARNNAMSVSAYSPSTSSYARPRIDYRSQTPSAVTSSVGTSRFDREYRSVCRFDSKEPSVDRVDATFAQLYKRYVREPSKAYSGSTSASVSSSTASSNQSSPITKQFISKSEAEEEFSCESELDEFPARRSTINALPPTAPRGATARPAEVRKAVSPPPRVASSEGRSRPQPQQSTGGGEKKEERKTETARVLLPPPSPTASTTAGAENASKCPPAVSPSPPTDSTSSSDSPAASTPSSSSSQSPRAPTVVANVSVAPAAKALTFEEKYRDLPTTTTHIEPKKLKGTSELDKLLRLAEMEKNPKSILKSGAVLPKVVSSAVQQAETPKSSKTDPRESSPASLKKSVAKKENSPTPSNKAVVKKAVDPAAVKESTPTQSAADSVAKMAAAPKSILKKESSPVEKSAKTKARRSRSKSKSPQPTSVAAGTSKEEKEKTGTGKPASRAQRRERTLEMEKYVLEKLEKVKQEQEDPQQPAKLSVKSDASATRPPLLLVTQPSIPSTPISTTANVVWNSASGVDGSESEWDEEEEEEEFASSEEIEECEFTVSLPTPTIPGGTTRTPKGDLYPVDANRLRSSTPFSDYDSEFELPFVQAESRNDSRGRVSQSNAVPPPVFTASVHYDGQDAWGDNGSDSETEYFPVPSRLGVSSADSRQYLSPLPYTDDDDFQETVDVGCTLTLVEQAARKDSQDAEEESGSEFYSDEFTEEEYSYYEEEETWEDEEEELDDEEWDEDVDMSASITLPRARTASPERFLSVPPRAKPPPPEEPPTTKRQSSPEPPKPKTAEKEKTAEMSVTPKKSEHKKTPSAAVETPKASLSEAVRDQSKKTSVTASSKESVKPSGEQKPQEVKAGGDTKSASKQKTPEPSKPKAAVKEKTPEPKKAATASSGGAATKLAKEKTPEKKETVSTEKSKTPEPAKVTNKKEKTPDTKTSSAAVSAKTAITTAAPTSTKTAAAATKTTTTTPSTTTATKPKTKTVSKSTKPEDGAVEKPKVAEDKSGVRKSTLNMAEEEKRVAEKRHAEVAKQNARRTGTVSSMLDRFREPTPPKQEKITYKRSTLLEPKEDRPRRTFAPIVKPVDSGDFDKQMAELREQMKSGSSRLRDQYQAVSKDIHTDADERKIQTLKNRTKDAIGSSQSLVTKAEEEKRRWREQHESEAEKRHREATEKAEAKRVRLEEEKKSAQLAAPPRTKTIRRSKAKEASLTPEPPEASQPRQVQPQDIPGSTSTSVANAEAGAKGAKLGLTEQRQTGQIETTGMAKKRIVSEAIAKSEAGGVASKLRKALGQKPSTEPPPPTATSTPTPSTPSAPADPTTASALKADVRGPKRYSSRRKTEEIIPPSKETLEPMEKRRKPQHRPNRFTKRPFDIDVLLGWDKENDVSFEAMEAFFAKQSTAKTTSDANGPAKKKQRRLEAQKVWISELKDIDKIYKASELRDIKLSATA